jgi:hypothetical protein
MREYFKTPEDVRDFFYDNLGTCGCSEMDEMIYTIKCFLDWANQEIGKRKNYDEVDDPGIYYIIAGILNKAKIFEHGSAIRCPWLTMKGKQLLIALNKFTVEEIDKLEGE